MQIAKDTIVRFHYSLAEPGQPTLETSFDREPLAVLIGRGNILPALEEAMLGRAAGERFSITLSPEQAYGEHRDGAVQRVSKKVFGPQRLKPGLQTVLQTKFGPRMVTVLKVGMSVVDIDLNHPMAGKTLEFDVRIEDVRAATEEELAHGHAHGEGGHQHD